MAVNFFNKAWNYERNVTISSSGGNVISGHTPSMAIDYDMNTYYENDSLSSLIINLGSAKEIDSLFMKCENVVTFKLYSSTDGNSWSEITDSGLVEKESGIFWWFAFTKSTKAFWKIEITAKDSGNIKIHEIMLMELRLALTEDADLPSMVVITPKDTIGGSYALVDGSVTSYAGTKAYSEIDIEFTNLPSDIYDSLYLLFTTPYLRYPLVVIPDDDKPSYIYRCVWADDAFNFKYSQSLKLSGFDGSIKLMEY